MDLSLKVGFTHNQWSPFYNLLLITRAVTVTYLSKIDTYTKTQSHSWHVDLPSLKLTAKAPENKNDVGRLSFPFCWEGFLADCYCCLFTVLSFPNSLQSPLFGFQEKHVKKFPVAKWVPASYEWSLHGGHAIHGNWPIYFRQKLGWNNPTNVK